jgi:hypothetical protein
MMEKAAHGHLNLREEPPSLQMKLSKAQPGIKLLNKITLCFTSVFFTNLVPASQAQSAAAPPQVQEAEAQSQQSQPQAQVEPQIEAAFATKAASHPSSLSAPSGQVVPPDSAVGSSDSKIELKADSAAVAGLTASLGAPGDSATQSEDDDESEEQQDEEDDEVDYLLSFIMLQSYRVHSS